MTTTVSLFCGAGGESIGKDLAFRELGLDVEAMTAHAINHWDLAVAAHGLNLPAVLVHQEDITRVTARTYGLRTIDLLWASPSCVHHSRARGGKPCSDQQRSHAWEVLERWIEVARVKVFLMENVPEFQDYGPLDRATQQPIKARKGEYFRAFVRRLRALGYTVDWRVLCAADYGDPTTRRRLFLQAVCDGREIAWPEPTHRDPRKPAKPGQEALPPWRSAATCIDWSLRCPSIFDRKRPLADATMRRIAAGVARFVLQGKPFLVTCNHTDDSFRGQSVEQPFGTITAAHDARGVVTPFVAGLAHGEKRDGGHRRSKAISEPLTTIHAGGNNHALVTPFLANFQGTSPSQIRSDASGIGNPMKTVTAQARHQALVTPFLAGVGGRMGQGKVSTRGAALPMPTLTTKGDAALVAPCLIQTSYGERKGQAPRVLGLERPLGTVVAGGQKHSLAAAFLSKHYGGPGAMEKQPAGLHPTSPMGTVTAQDKHSLAAAHITKFQQNSTGQPADEPLHTVMAGATRFGGVTAELGAAATERAKLVAAFLLHWYSHGNPGQRIDLPMHTVTTIERHGLVTVEIDGSDYVITDIGLRMLEPRELALAMGFPRWYRWERADGTPLSKRDAVRLIGNACPVGTVKELIKAVVLQRPRAFGLEAA